MQAAVQFIKMKPSTILTFLIPKSAAAYLTYDANSSFQRTGIKREIYWEQFAEPVSLASEVALFRRNVLYRPGEFGPLDASRQLELELECGAVGMTYHQGHSMRKQMLIKQTLKNGDKLKDRKMVERLSKAFANEHKSLLDMSRELNLPPVSIFRSIIWSRLARHKVHSNQEKSRIIKSMIYECNMEQINEYLSDWEFEQMQMAKRNDIVGFAGHDGNTAKDWEDQVLKFLDSHEINFVVEDDLRQSDAKSTPDCLVLDDLYVNKRPIRWIEVKSFYASGLNDNMYITKKSLFNQVKRYNTEFGSGAVILKNGFCDVISSKLETTLLLDGGPLSDTTEIFP